MKKTESNYATHLALREISLPPSSEWSPRLPGWTLVQATGGAGYFLQAAFNRELEAGTVLVLGENSRGSIRASQLGELTLQIFNVVPARLTGLVSLGEQRFFEAAASMKEWAIQVLAPSHPLAAAMRELSTSRDGAGLATRLKLLQVFVELFGPGLGQTAPELDPADARKRLRDFLDQAPSSDLLEMNFEELAQITHCTPRHLSRVFHELVGMSFRDKRAELRLARARELLVNTDSKILDVALESGYKSLSLFNLMFARHFGSSPARWRKQQGKRKSTGIRRVEGMPEQN